MEEFKTAKEIFEKNKNNSNIEALLDEAIKFEEDADEDGKYIRDDFDRENVIQDISEKLFDILKVEADDFTDAIGEMVDEASEMILDYHYDGLKDSWQEASLCASDPYKYYGVRRSDF